VSTRAAKVPSSPCRAYACLMPAEWEPHAATWIAWPHNRDDWPGKLQPIPWVYAEIVRHLARHEAVEIIVNDQTSEKNARKILKDANVLGDAVHFHRWKTDRVWTRDYGPIFVRNYAGSGRNQSIATCWQFNAWAKYPNWKKDALINSKIAITTGAKPIHPETAVKGKNRPVVLEGGSIDVNGKGTLLTTEECLLSDVQQRNPGMTREMLEATFTEHLGIRKVVWLGKGIVGDDTHGHVDDIARFVAPDAIVAVAEQNTEDPNHGPLADNLRRLRSATDQDGRALRVIELPMPGPVVFRGRRLPASYANFYIANGLVLVPMFNDKNDRVALDILSGLFPDREVIGIYCGDLIWGFGALHCMTQQQPEFG